jgi:hypothetical protein
MRLPILFVVCVVAARPSAGVAQMGAGLGIGGAAGAAQVQTAPAGATRLYVKTHPPGAQVTLDGTVLGQSDGLFLVPAGTGKVSVQFDGAQPEVRQVEIAEGRITRVEVNFAGDQPAGAAVDLGPAFAAGKQAVPRFRLTSKREPVKPKPLTAIDGALNKPLEQPLEFVETPLRDVIDPFRQVTGIDVLIDRRGLADDGVDLDTRITAHVPAGLPLAAALEMVVRETGLAWIVRNDLLEVTSLERAQDKERLLVHVHDVADLAENADQLLVDLVQSSVAPETWDSAGGQGAIRPDSAALVISQSFQVQRQVAGLLDVLRRLKATPAEDRRPLGVGGYWSELPVAVAARAALAKPVTADVNDTALRKVTAGLADEAGVPITVDTRAFTDAGLDLDRQVTFAVSGKPLAVVLARILEPLDLVVEVRDEGLVVTTKGQSQETMTVAVYPVGHLGGGDRSVGSLADMVTSTIQPDTWESVGGYAVVKPVDGDVPCLVVRQSTAGHRAVHEFLESLPPSRQPGEFAPTLESAQGMGVGICWVAREVYGPNDPRWLVFRDWLTTAAPAWLHDLYAKHGESFAAWIRDKPVVKSMLRMLMDRVVDATPAMPGAE